MKRILFAAAVWLFGCAGALAQQTGPIYCGQSVVINTAATQKAVADPLVGPTGTIPGNQKVYVCGYVVVATAAGTFQLQSGLGASCATAGGVTTPSKALTGAMSLAANEALVDSSPTFRGTVTDQGAGLCVVVTGTGPIVGVLYYEQY
jgi:hypothetical protein